MHYYTLINHGNGRVNCETWDESATELDRGNPMHAPVIKNALGKLRTEIIKHGKSVKSKRPIEVYMLKYFHQLIIRVENKLGRPWIYDRLLQLQTIVMFLCLLSGEEAMRIQFKMVQYVSQENSLTISLPFRKTHQYGDMKPFKLFALPGMDHLCPVRAFARYIQVLDLNEVTGETYLFLNATATGRRTTQNYLRAPDTQVMSRQAIGAYPNEAEVEDSHVHIGINKGVHYETQLTAAMLKNNIDFFLEAVRVDPKEYGAHSFRRGGTQFLNISCNWPLRQIVNWAGWASGLDGKDFRLCNNMISRYLFNSHANNLMSVNVMHPLNLIRFRIVAPGIHLVPEFPSFQ
jgi:hypothetical protein